MATYAALGYIDDSTELDATYIRRDDYYAKGQIGTYNTATGDFDVLPPGTNGYVLSADSLSTYGLTWIPPPTDNDLDSVATRNWGAGTGRTIGTADNVVIGDSSNANAVSRSIVLGSTAATTGNDSITLGYGATSNTNSVSIGRSAITLDDGVSIGRAASSGSNGVAVGRTAQCGATSLAIGLNAGVAAHTGNQCIFLGVNAQPLATTNSDATAVGANAVAGEQGTSVGSATDAGLRSLASGFQAQALTDDTVSLGYQSGFIGTGGSSVYVGAQAYGTNHTFQVALGAGAGCNQELACAIGGGSRAGRYTVAINSYADVQNSTVVGTLSLASGNNSTIFGYNNTTGASLNSVILGQNSGRSLMTAAATNNIFVGNSLATITLTSGSSNVLVGSSSGVLAATTSNGIGIGPNVAISSNTVAIGSGSTAGGQYCIAIGDTANINSTAAPNGIAIGRNATISMTTDCDGATALGYAALVAAGGTRSISIGRNCRAGGVDNIVVGPNAGNLLLSGTQNVFLGANAGTTTTSGSRNTCIGRQSRPGSSADDDVTCVGQNTHGSTQAVIIGSNSGSPSSNSTAVGYSTLTNIVVNGTCLGHSSNIAAGISNCNAIGYATVNSTANSTLIGANNNSDHIVDSQGIFRSVKQVMCIANDGGQVIAGPGPTKLSLSTEQRSYPVGLLDNVNDWIYLSSPGTEAAGRTYQLSWTWDAQAGAVNNQWSVTVLLNEPGIAGTPRIVAWDHMCSAIIASCRGSGSTTVSINPAITGRPYFYVEIFRQTGAGNMTITDYRSTFCRIN